MNVKLSIQMGIKRIRLNVKLSIQTNSGLSKVECKIIDSTEVTRLCTVTFGWKSNEYKIINSNDRESGGEGVWGRERN